MKNDHEKALKLLARTGYAARGAVYLIIGYFALLAGIGSGGTTDSEGALRSLLGQPFGTILVGLMVVGLLGHAGWRVTQAVMDADNHGTDAKGVVVRAGLLASGLIHLSLAGFALSLISGWGSGGGGDPTGGWLAYAIEQGWGRFITIAAGLIPIGVGAALIWKGWKSGFEKHFEADARAMARLRPVCRVGLIARGIVFMIIGVLTLYANAAYDPAQAPGLEDALDALSGMPAGWLLLTAMGAGLLAFAVYSFAAAYYRRVEMG